MSPASEASRRSVLITGAAGGFGTALCRAFAEAGWRVGAGIHRTPLPLAHPAVTAIPLDVLSPEDPGRAVRLLESAHGHVDVLVNNAGIARDGVLPLMTDPAWSEVVDVNLKGAWRCAAAAFRAMRAAGRGHIIQIASHGGRTGRAGQANYCASKAALLGLSAALAREGAPFGIQVNTVLPGFMPTPITGTLDPAAIARAASENLLNRLNDPDEAARFVVHLAGMRNVSGQVFALDSRVAPWT